MCFGFVCKSPPKECISNFLRCDGTRNCLDGSDEEFCEEKIYAVDELHVDHHSLSANSFRITWKSPNSTENFLYLPSYSNYENESISFNTSWTRSEWFTFTKLQSGSTYKVFVYCKLLNSNGEQNKTYAPTSFIKVTTISVGM